MSWFKKNKKKVVSPRVSADDVRVDNFFLHKEDFHFKLGDVSGAFTVRIPSVLLNGTFFDVIYEGCKLGQEDKQQFFGAYCSVLFNYLSCVPDADFLNSVNEAVIDCMNRHKDLYNIREDLSKDRDDEILKEEEDLFEEEKALGI